MAAKGAALDDAFQVSLDQYLLEGLIHNWTGLWKRFGNLESWAMQDRLEGIEIRSPIYVAGLARSGSTILLEFLAAHAKVTTHEYRDFPLIFTPSWSQAIQATAAGNAASEGSTATERAHGDGIMITPESPEAMEEPIWMAFFRGAHDPTRCSVLDECDHHPKFERFYKDHIRKLLSLRGGQRYASKGNYNISRLSYLQRLFPDMRVVIPIRNPVNHVASLVKQHRLFVDAETRHPRALKHMQRVGHFEFGLDRRPIHFAKHGYTDGDARHGANKTEGNSTTAEIVELWNQGEDVRGYARYWAHVYGWVHQELRRNANLRDAAYVLRYEDLCADSLPLLTRLQKHASLHDEAQLAHEFADRLQTPSYYQPAFSDEELGIIHEETHHVAAQYGYGAQPNTPSIPVIPEIILTPTELSPTTTW